MESKSIKAEALKNIDSANISILVDLALVLMSKMLTFRMMAFDTQTLPEEILTGYTQTFFNDDLNSKDESAAKQDERTILK